MTILIQTPLDLIPAPPQLDLDGTIAAWLDAKFRRSRSENTRSAYTETTGAFRVALAPTGLDLDGDPRAVSLAAQGWAGLGDVAPSTFNRRLAVLSSFYTFAIKRGLLSTNPIALVERAKVELYAEARALDLSALRLRLSQIDRTTPEGMRDYALLAVFLQTGRRLAEVAALRWGDLHLSGSKVTLHFRRTKGGKTASDTLPTGISKAVLGWLHGHYRQALGGLPHDAPIWVSLSRNNHGQALTTRGVSYICEQRLGVSKVHALRHTFAHAMEQAGAKVSDIQARLGHSSLATTGRYLAALKRAENDQADAIAAMFGLDD